MNPRKRNSGKASSLTPTQANTVNRLLELWPTSSVFCLWSHPGMGRTAMSRHLSKTLDNASIVSARDWFLTLEDRHPVQIEENFIGKALESLTTCNALIVDDFDRFICVTGDCNMMYPRRGLVQSALLTLLEAVRIEEKKVVFVGDGQLGEVVGPRSLYFGFKKFELADYEFLIQHYLGERASRIDSGKVFMFAPRLTAHQLRGCFDALSARSAITTEDVIKYLENHKMASNVDVEQVRKVTLDDLKGVDDILKTLRRYVVTPLLEKKLASEYRLKPKRGILLYGPPGTGKTSVGRALAGQLRSKFFKIDGTFIAGTRDYYERIRHVFENAKDNAPSMVFIDDCDTIFQDDEDGGLYRYLLTLLDGIESENMGGITVLLTAMNTAALPPALIRSGRIELWLEMKKPDTQAREEILSVRVQSLPVLRQPKQLSKVATATEGFTGADIERLVEDAKAVMLEAELAGSLDGDTTYCFLTAAEEIRRNVSAMEKAATSADALGRFKMSDPFARLMAARAMGDEDSPSEP